MRAFERLSLIQVFDYLEVRKRFQSISMNQIQELCQTFFRILLNFSKPNVVSDIIKTN